LQTLRTVFSRHFLGRVFVPSPKILPSKRILITADLGELWHHPPLEMLLGRLARLKIPLTLFCSNEFLDGRSGYPVIRKIISSAREKNLRLEIGSHSLRHVSLSGGGIDKAVAVIKESVLAFREKGIPVVGFRAPYLSIERMYPGVLKALSAEKGILAYDSSTLYERNLILSRVHDVLRWKPPHRVGDIWEMPLSCLDDYHLFEKLRKDDAFVRSYWAGKAEASLGRYNYFHLLVHPEIISRHFSALDDFLAGCLVRYSRSAFATCREVAAELDHEGRG
jgi:peptidoglycan/xylan/chitin deacetylase (PgdA/CDA1 family)